MSLRKGLGILLVVLLAGCTDEPTSQPPGASPPPPPPPPNQPGHQPPVGYFVAPNGTGRGDGSISQPWDYEYAFSGAGGAIQPGDTVWFRAGTYSLTEHRSITVSGDGETRRVVFRAYPGERAVFAAPRAAEV